MVPVNPLISFLKLFYFIQGIWGTNNRKSPQSEFIHRLSNSDVDALWGGEQDEPLGCEY